MLEAYDQQSDEAAKIFPEHHKRLRQYVNQARDVQRLSVDSSVEVVNSYSNSGKDAVYSTVKGTKTEGDVIRIETTRERNIQTACECLAVQMIDKIRNSFPAYEGSGHQFHVQLTDSTVLTLCVLLQAQKVIEKEARDLKVVFSSNWWFCVNDSD